MKSTRKLGIGLALAVSTTCGTAAFAGPDETIDFFMEDSVSMLDWGIFRVEQRLNDQLPVQFRTAYVSYDWDDNIIHITSFVFNTTEDHREACEYFFEEVRRIAGTHLVPQPMDYTFFSGFFSHEGFTTTVHGESFEELLVDLDNKFRINLSVTTGSNWTRCNGRLLGDSIAYEEGTYE